MKNKIFIALVFFLLISIALCAPILRILDDKGIINSAAGNQPDKPRVHDGFAAPILNEIEQLKNEIDYTYLNHIPFYTNMVKTRNNLFRSVNEPCFAMLDYFTGLNSNQPINEKPPVDKDEVYVVNHSCEFISEAGVSRHYLVKLELSDGRKIEFLDTALVFSDAEKKTRMDYQIEQLNRIIKSDTDVNFCVYVASGFENMSFFSDYIPEENSTYDYMIDFLSRLDKSTGTGYLNMDNIIKRTELAYLTDHHWSQLGAYKGYCDILDILRRSAPEILPPRELGRPVTFADTKFYGSYARGLAYSSLWDQFTVYDYDLPTHTTDPKYDFDGQIGWLTANPITQMNSNVYGLFFPQLYKLRYPDNHTGRNLLILGDSYTQGFSELIASSFDNTYIYYYTGYRGMNYNEIIERYDITDVVFMQFQTRMLFNATNDCALESIITTPVSNKEDN